MATNAVMIVPEPRNLPVPIAEAFRRAMDEVITLVQSPEVQSRFAAVLLSELRTNAQLQKCTPESLVLAVVEMAQHGLDPSADNECYLIPYTIYDRNDRPIGVEAQMQIGYGGLIKLACSHPDVDDVWSEEVCANDHYIYHGLDRRPTHDYPGNFQPRGAAIGYYAIALLSRQRVRCIQMSVEEIKEHAKRYSRNAEKKVWSQGKGGGFQGMAKKTMLRRICDPKYIPMAGRVAAFMRGQETLEAVPIVRDVDSPLVVAQRAREELKTLAEHIEDLTGPAPAVTDAAVPAASPAPGTDTGAQLTYGDPAPPAEQGALEENGLTPAPPAEQGAIEYGDVPAPVGAQGARKADEPEPTPAEVEQEEARGLRAELEALQAQIGWTASQRNTWRNRQTRRFKKDYAALSPTVLQGLLLEVRHTLAQEPPASTAATRPVAEEATAPDATPAPAQPEPVARHAPEEHPARGDSPVPSGVDRSDPAQRDGAASSPEGEPITDERWRAVLHQLASNTLELLHDSHDAPWALDARKTCEVTLRLCDNPTFTEAEAQDVTARLHAIGDVVAEQMGMGF